MNLTIEQRKQALGSASETQVRLYSDPESGELLGKIGDDHSVIITDYSTFAIAIGDVILGLVPQEKLPDHLIESLEITRPEAMKVTADVLDFLAPLSGEVAKAAPTAAAAPISDNEVLEVEIAQAEAALNSSVQPMRTMAHDMETARQPEATHKTTSQSDLLSGNQVQNPNATWDTTQS